MTAVARRGPDTLHYSTSKTDMQCCSRHTECIHKGHQVWHGRLGTEGILCPIRIVSGVKERHVSVTYVFWRRIAL